VGVKSIFIFSKESLSLDELETPWWGRGEIFMSKCPLLIHKFIIGFPKWKLEFSHGYFFMKTLFI
jgi:hypothetical protein